MSWKRPIGKKWHPVIELNHMSLRCYGWYRWDDFLSFRHLDQLKM